MYTKYKIKSYTNIFATEEYNMKKWNKYATWYRRYVRAERAREGEKSFWENLKRLFVWHEKKVSTQVSSVLFLFQTHERNIWLVWLCSRSHKKAHKIDSSVGKLRATRINKQQLHWRWSWLRSESFVFIHSPLRLVYTLLCVIPRWIWKFHWSSSRCCWMEQREKMGSFICMSTAAQSPQNSISCVSRNVDDCRRLSLISLRGKSAQNKQTDRPRSCKEKKKKPEKMWACHTEFEPWLRR